MQKLQLSLTYSTDVVVKIPELRPYQAQGVEEMRALVSTGVRRIVLCGFVGSGKTVVAAHVVRLARGLGKRVLFIAHRIELINQAARQLATFGVTDIGIIRADDHRTDPSAPVQIASIDTLRARVMPEADVVFIDEAHRANSESYLKVFDHYPQALHIGLTATPFRSDNQGLGQIYQALVTYAKPSQLIADGFIVEPKIYCAPILPDVSDVEYSALAHDFHNRQLGNNMMRGKLMGNIVLEWQQRAQGRRTVIFAVNVEHSKKIIEEFRREGIRAAHIDGTTPKDERSLILNKLERNEIQVISNCDVLTEGWDQPSVKCLVLACPTMSLRRYIQQCGRVLRPFQDDAFSDAPNSCIILDHAGNVERHGLPHQDRDYDLKDGQRKAKSGPALSTCPSCYLMWLGTSPTCPECGAEKPKKDAKVITSDSGVRLVELDPVTLISNPLDAKRTFFLKGVRDAKERGTKPGAVAHRYKEKFGAWPPYSWTQEVNTMFANDPQWQLEVQKRTAVREFWQARNNENSAPRENSETFTEEPKEDRWYEDEEVPF